MDPLVLVGLLIALVVVLGVLLAQARVAKARLDEQLRLEKEHATARIALLADSEARLSMAFENLANRIFDEKGRALDEHGRERLGGLLQPFREQLEAFRKRVEEVHRSDAEQSVRLVEQIRQLQAMSNQVSADANALADAIRGNAKVQGDWGELVIARIFEASGLEMGREYEPQKVFTTDEGSTQRPDFVVMLPGDKVVMVDAKVSLTAYERYCRVEDEAERQAALGEHVKSVRRHIKALAEKDYTSLLGSRTLDFVVMCIPLEPAYQAALQADEALLYDLARTRVVLTGPATLMITLKLIAQIWRREQQNQNAEIIAERGGKLVDQVVLIYEAVVEAQRHLGGAAESMDLVLKRLKDGRGSLVSRAETLRKLGAKVSKTLPESADEGDEE